MFLLAVSYEPERNDMERDIEFLCNKVLTQLSLVQVYSQVSKIRYMLTSKSHYND